jgi:Glycosyltransferase family 87
MLLGFNKDGYSKYENYRIFKYAWHYFITGQNPYTGHPETWDLYKYSPAFCVTMAPFYAVPDWIGLIVWNLTNVLVLLVTIFILPGFSPQKRIIIAWFVFPELIIAVQSAQSNALMAALLLLGYIGLEHKKSFASAGWIMSSAFIKIFGIFAAFLAVFYPKQWWAFGISLIVWGLVFALFPIVFIGWPHLKQLYFWWWELLRNDHSASTGLSVSGWLHTWFGLQPPKFWITAIGLSIQLLAVLVQAYRKQSVIPILASLLIWVVIFNHKAESPTFIIAVTGAAIWYFSIKNPKISDQLLLWVAFFLASITPTDLFPRSLFNQWVQPYTLKAVPFIVIWAVIMIDIFRNEQRTDLEVS